MQVDSFGKRPQWQAKNTRHVPEEISLQHNWELSEVTQSPTHFWLSSCTVPTVHHDYYFLIREGVRKKIYNAAINTLPNAHYKKEALAPSPADPLPPQHIHLVWVRHLAGFGTLLLIKTRPGGIPQIPTVTIQACSNAHFLCMTDGLFSEIC